MLRKLFNSDLFMLFILAAIIYIALMVSLLSLDKHGYSGVDVIKQDGNVLFVTLDDQFTIGTDSMCLEATKVLANVALQTGCYIQVIAEDNQWTPFQDRVMSLSDLTNIIESGTPY